MKKVENLYSMFEKAQYLLDPTFEEVVEAVIVFMEEEYTQEEYVFTGRHMGKTVHEIFIEKYKEIVEDKYTDPSLYCLPCQAIDKNGCHCPMPFEIND